MILAVALPGLIVPIAAGLVWTVRLLHVSGLDAQALADKVAFSEPASALEWPEMQVRSVLPEPDALSPVIVHVRWPAYPSRVAFLLVSLDHDERLALSVLSRWSATGASVTAERRGTELELRRRQSLERVHAILIAEDYRAAS